MTIQCPKCKCILNKHTPKFCPDCGHLVPVEEDKAGPKYRTREIDEELDIEEPIDHSETIVTRDDQLAMRIGMLEGAAKVFKEQIAAQTQNITDTQVAVKGLQSQIEGLHLMTCREDNKLSERLESLEGVVVVVKDSTSNTLQRLAAAEDVIHNLQEKVNDLDMVTVETIVQQNREIARLKQSAKQEPACKRCNGLGKIGYGTGLPLDPCPDCQSRPAVEFTPEEIAEAIDESISYSIDFLSSGDLRALRAAKDHILAAKPTTYQPCGKEPARRPMPAKPTPDAH